MMSDFLSREIRAELDAARRTKLRKKSRLRVSDGTDTYPILRLLPEGFTLDAAEVEHLRGLVDVYDGARHLSQCLIVASDIEGGELICRMKWSTAARAAPPADYVRDDNGPTGYLPRR
ncbi:MAG: hypothetical protein U1E48_16195 [Paracoccaceae bacterium]|mgnify:CR=1 FL=1